MKTINVELDELMKKAAEELQIENLEPLLKGLQQKILDCYEIEKKAFERLNDVVK